jgi:hypothetical protein
MFKKACKMKLFLLFFLLPFALFGEDNYYYANGKKVTLAPLESSSSAFSRAHNDNSIRYYKNQNDTLVGITDELLVQTDALEPLLQKYDLILLERVGTNIYLLRTKEDVSALETANRIYEAKDALLAHPNFYKKAGLR